MLPFTNPSLITDNGEIRLRDDRTIGTLCSRIGELQIILDDCADFLRTDDFPATEDDIFEVLNHGRNGLLAVVWKRADREAKRLNCRPYVAKTWREQERAAVTPEQWNKADALHSRYDRIADGLGLDRSTDISTTEDGRLIVEATVMAKRIETAFTIAITDDMKLDLAKLLDLADQVKAMELRGINALELVEKFVRANERPTDLELYKAIVFRRHSAGTIHQKDMDWLMNHTAKNNPNFNPLNN